MKDLQKLETLTEAIGVEVADIEELIEDGEFEKYIKTSYQAAFSKFCQKVKTYCSNIATYNDNIYSVFENACAVDSKDNIEKFSDENKILKGLLKEYIEKCGQYENNDDIQYIKIKFGIDLN